MRQGGVFFTIHFKQRHQSEVDCGGSETHILQLKLRSVNNHVVQIDEIRAKRTAKFAITVNIKCRNDQICPERAENKVKQSSVVYYLVTRENKVKQSSILDYLVYSPPRFVIFMLNLFKSCQKHMCMDVSLNYGWLQIFLPKYVKFFFPSMWVKFFFSLPCLGEFFPFFFHVWVFFFFNF